METIIYEDGNDISFIYYKPNFLPKDKYEKLKDWLHTNQITREVFHLIKQKYLESKFGIKKMENIFQRIGMDVFQDGNHVLMMII